MKQLAGKTADFDVKVTAVAKPKKPEIDEDFAKGLGAESLEKLRELVSEQIKREYDQASRAKLKREILDPLDAEHKFELPASLVDFEFDNIWTQLENNLKATDKSFADEGKTEDEARAEYRGIAERRVRLGLVIGEIGEKNELKVTQDEMRRALDRAGPPLSRPGKAGLRVLRKDAGSAGRASRPDFRGQGHRSRDRAGKPNRKESIRGRTA